MVAADDRPQERQRQIVGVADDGADHQGSRAAGDAEFDTFELVGGGRLDAELGALRPYAAALHELGQQFGSADDQGQVVGSVGRGRQLRRRIAADVALGERYWWPTAATAVISNSRSAGETLSRAPRLLPATTARTSISSESMACCARSSCRHSRAAATAPYTSFGGATTVPRPFCRITCPSASRTSSALRVTVRLIPNQALGVGLRGQFLTRLPVPGVDVFLEHLLQLVVQRDRAVTVELSARSKNRRT